jgi:hypothetical protein
MHACTRTTLQLDAGMGDFRKPLKDFQSALPITTDSIDSIKAVLAKDNGSPIAGIMTSRAPFDQ